MWTRCLPRIARAKVTVIPDSRDARQNSCVVLRIRARARRPRTRCPPQADNLPNDRCVSSAAVRFSGSPDRTDGRRSRRRSLLDSDGLRFSESRADRAASAAAIPAG